MKMRVPAHDEALESASPPPAPESADVPAGRGPRKPLRTLLKALVSLALILWILRGASVSEIIAAMKGADPAYVAGAFLLFLVGWVISVSRWRLLLAAQGVPARFGYLIQSYMVAIFFNNLLPSTIGGDTIRAYDSWRLGKRKADAVTVIFVDRFMGMLALLLCALAATFGMRWLPQDLPLLSLWMGAAGASIVLLTWILFMPPARLRTALGGMRLPLPRPVRGKVARLAEALSVFQDSRPALFKALCLSLVLQLNVILHYSLIAAALGLQVPVFAFFLIVPVALAFMALPISINAIGIRESVFAFFLGMFGVATVDAVAFAWVAYGLVLLQGMVGGVVHALRR